ncbi:MAG TPA: peptidylprolyl isomerase, partial [Blastocatellia bacterium]|nr:peptidylprolyl isomerase [Blastocatellia bacterium]
MQVARIDDQVITAEDFVKSLTFHGLMDDIMENMMSERLTVIEAKKQGIRISDDELQERADQLRRVQGLHRQKDTLDWLDSMGISVDEFEQFLKDGLYKEKMLAEITSDQAVEEYFKLNSPKFEAVELSHIMVDSEPKARELVAYLNEEPDDFKAMAKEHSLADTGKQGGKLGRILRETLSEIVEAKVFNAPVGGVLG